ncbi:hypothetical protein L9F63_001863 [Diploptera punctata]|uniref:C2H2-type domain-containing protein n=1 Tax=Diploptera punctata TaxID=6984 RepID=A0AAD8A368_DIPPU|nr:hypothetical protein L9F63_001863 [Diploptera punctata]
MDCQFAIKHEVLPKTDIVSQDINMEIKSEVDDECGSDYFKCETFPAFDPLVLEKSTLEGEQSEECSGKLVEKPQVNVTTSGPHIEEVKYSGNVNNFSGKCTSIEYSKTGDKVVACIISSAQNYFTPLVSKHFKKCSVCQKYFICNYNLYRHLATHTNKELYKCSLSKVFHLKVQS